MAILGEIIRAACSKRRSGTDLARVTQGAQGVGLAGAGQSKGRTLTPRSTNLPWASCCLMARGIRSCSKVSQVLPEGSRVEQGTVSATTVGSLNWPHSWPTRSCRRWRVYESAYPASSDWLSSGLRFREIHWRTGRPPLQISQRRPGGFASGVAADHAAALLPAALAFDLVGGGAVLGHAPGHADAPAVAAEEFPVYEAGSFGNHLHPPGDLRFRPVVQFCSAQLS